ncbi:MAG: FHA domain-containing protein [Akkermansiaceae bacterium]|nr:FHA domain-containing protein [Armatimonadota bacterium]
MTNVTGRILLLTLAGITAGILTWLLSDMSGLIRLPDTGGALTTEQASQQALICTFFGAMIGLMLGLADMIATGMQAQWLRITGYGVLIGAAAGFVGINFGIPFYSLLHVENVTNSFQFLLNTLARALGWAFIGALAGCADGIRKWSGRTIRNGVIGGFIGGLVGGTVFEAAVYLFAFVPRPAVVSRLLGFVITGGLIGLFIGLVQQLLKEAWVRIVLGKNEGREVLIDKEQTTIGRSELSDIGLFGDMSVAKNHAVVVAAPNGGYVLRDVSGQPGTVSVNERKAQGGEDIPIRGGDTIRIGNKTLLFFERFTKERTAVAKDGRVPKAGSPAPIPGSSSLPPLTGGFGSAQTSPSGGGAAVSPGNPFAPTKQSDGYKLVVVSGPHTGQIFPARSGSIIGRDPSVDISISQDTSASRRHARIVQEALSVAIEDAGSTNGTFVNGQRITRQSLVPGDTVVIGGTSLRLE